MNCLTCQWRFVFRTLTWRDAPEVDLGPGVVGWVAAVWQLDLVVVLLRRH